MTKALLLAVSLTPALALAQTVPGVMSYQGRLLDSSGAAVTGTPSVTFSIYAAGEGGTALWTETRTLTLTYGFYAVQLGSQTAFPANLFDGSARWLGVKVGDDAEMTPRQFLATVPYAFRALNATSATNATNATNVVAGGSVTTGGVTTSGNLTVNGAALRVPGSVVGGGQVTSSSCGSSGCSYSCSAWGDGGCSTSSSSGPSPMAVNCNSRTHPAGFVRGTPVFLAGGSSATGLFLCIQAP